MIGLIGIEKAPVRIAGIASSEKTAQNGAVFAKSGSEFGQNGAVLMQNARCTMHNLSLRILHREFYIVH